MGLRDLLGMSSQNSDSDGFSATVDGITVTAKSAEGLRKAVAAVRGTAAPTVKKKKPVPPVKQPQQQSPQASAPEETEMTADEVMTALANPKTGMRKLLKQGGFDPYERIEKMGVMMQQLAQQQIRDRLEFAVQMEGVTGVDFANPKTLQTLDAAVQDGGGDMSVAGIRKALRTAIDNDWLEGATTSAKQAPAEQRAAPAVPGAMEAAGARPQQEESRAVDATEDEVERALNAAADQGADALTDLYSRLKAELAKTDAGTGGIQ